MTDPDPDSPDPDSPDRPLEVGDVLQLMHGPFLSDWRVVEIKEHGAILERAGGPVELIGFGRLLEAPGGRTLTNTPRQEWLGRAGFASAIRQPWPSHWRTR